MNIVAIMIHFFNHLGWEIDNNDYNTLNVFNGEKPTLAELEAKWPETQAILAALDAKESKERTFQRQYSIQDQIVNIMEAISGNRTNFDVMKSFYDGIR